jgi:hypothetical protein
LATASPRRAADEFRPGLRAGDIVTAVNGLPLSDPANTMRLYQAMRSATSATFEVERDGERLTLDVALASAAGSSHELSRLRPGIGRVAMASLSGTRASCMPDRRGRGRRLRSGGPGPGLHGQSQGDGHPGADQVRAEATNTTIVVDPSVKGKVKVVSSRPVNPASSTICSCRFSTYTATRPCAPAA